MIRIRNPCHGDVKLVGPVASALQATRKGEAGHIHDRGIRLSYETEVTSLRCVRCIKSSHGLTSDSLNHTTWG